MTDAEPTALEELLAECIARAEEAGPEAVETLLGEHPALADEARAILEDLELIGMVGDEPTTPDPIGDRLGEYRLIRRLGEGGMGVVFLARQESVDRLCAVKVVHPTLARQPRAVERFRREAQALARVDHPHLVRVFGAGEDRGHLWLAMEYVPGRTLDRLLRDAERPSTERAVRWASQLARALAAVHAAGVVHRDVKPSNVVIDRSGAARLLDFGLAKDESSDRITATGAFQGTPHYAAPEQIAGDRAAIGPRVDVYGLGVTLYEALAGRVPFGGETAEQVFMNAMTGEAEPLRRRNRTISRDLETVVHHAIEREPKRRYANAVDLADDLEALLSFRPIRARPPGAARRALLWTRRNRGAAAVAAATVIALAALAFGAAWKERAESERRREEARASLVDVERRLSEARDGERGTVELERDVAERRRRMATAYFPDEAWRALDRDERELRRRRDAREDLFSALLAEVDRARQLGGPEADAERLRADVWLERWRVAHALGDRASASYFAGKVRAHDADGRHASVLAGRSTVSFTATVDGAEVHLFRYERQDDRSEDGAPRLVAVPRRGEPPVRPGTWCLRVAADRPPLLAGDLIVSIAGRPIGTDVLVVREAAGAERGDRLVEVAGRPVTRLHEYDEHSFVLGSDAARDVPSDREFRFERRGESVTLIGRTLEELGLEMGDARRLAAAGGVAAVVVRGEERFEETLPEGVEARITASPVTCTDATFAGATPCEVVLAEGAWLAVFRAEGRADAAVPFDVDGGAATTVDAALVPRGERPVGFVPIVRSPLGVPVPYWLMDHEVTLGMYVEFLNDPEVRARIDASPEPIRWPRELSNQRRGGFLGVRRGEPVSLVGRGDPEMPVLGVSVADAEAYAAWRTERARANGEPWIFSVPTLAEVDSVRAASSRRRFPTGDVFRPRWVKSGFATSYHCLEGVLRYPLDEVPPGVFDLAGSLSEWTTTFYDEENRLRWAIGGSWVNTEPEKFRLDFRKFLLESTAANAWGFRLVARRRPPADAPSGPDDE